ncbi:DUF3090 domain-containing protein [Tessaracoccus sp. MC1865]|uniref:DUF3090 domain-containing protein n=1 Tax=unclassified Tessaracoccus TaxID=2635419 RepID=UPI00096F455E|nr:MULTISPECIES: DUF3090 domain-containing protein [unclassified Tessaracoccus]MBB1484298.1 DUF3090 domain-containing protein [Tessaracoccus sp. MC1865]MBB1510792.1 DUF3090 domain-containing protein [Tessaracoccus sp. MC1756]MCG6568653.1 DUF3090 domain-containing protein [Tessaracoccus sp. ZS01]OMG51980.1 hypothetical protein BJN44_13630 [Tessaracoccus sp. ZS01]QTO38584.1 DUF3090 domain-containing protein [Tessaracoccus sp. MC1865]
MMLAFDNPDRCIVGTIGAPGERLFLIQVAQGNRLAAVALEKEQTLLLGVRVGDVLDQLAELGHEVPPRQPPADNGPLDAPVEVLFRAAAIGLAWDHERNRLLLELFSAEPDEEGENSLVQIRMTPVMAREFSSRAEVVVASGRPSCPACSQPLDPAGHICPRANGYRGPLFG